MDCRGARDRRQGIASIVAGVETVRADALVAWPAYEECVRAELDPAAVDASLTACLAGFPVDAGVDAGTADRRAVGLSESRLPGERGGQQNEAGRGKKKSAHHPRFSTSKWPFW